MEPYWSIISGIVIGIGLSAACGFRIILPFLGLSIAVMSGHIEPAPEFQWIGLYLGLGTNLDDILCEQDQRTVSADNCVSYKVMKLQIPANRYCCHYVRVRARVHKYMDGSLAIFRGPRKLADYDRHG